MKVDPVPEHGATNDDLARGINDAHLCLEDTRGTVSTINGQVAEIQHALGITPGGKKVAGLSTPWKAFVRSAGATATAIAGLLLLYRFAVSVWPSLWAFIGALNHVILTGKF